MKILVIGSGGREHALVWKLRQGRPISQLICVPGNAGIEQVAACRAFDVAQIDQLMALAEMEQSVNREKANISHVTAEIVN